MARPIASLGYQSWFCRWKCFPFTTWGWSTSLNNSYSNRSFAMNRRMHLPETKNFRVKSSRVFPRTPAVRIVVVRCVSSAKMYPSNCNAFRLLQGDSTCAGEVRMRSLRTGSGSTCAGAARSITACRAPICWRMCWYRSTQMIRRCIGSPRVLLGKDSTLAALPWPDGSARPVSCSRR
jgi:hypothetical protein